MVDALPESQGDDRKDMFGCEPWIPPPIEPLDPTAETFIQDTSGSYVARLEAKLIRIKGSGKEPTSRDLMKAIEKLHASYMDLLAGDKPVCTPTAEEELSDDEVETSKFQKKFFPARVALTMEEKALLMDHDILSKMYSEQEEKKLPLLMGWIPTDWDKDDDTVPSEEEDLNTHDQSADEDDSDKDKRPNSSEFSA